jgi:hypothetical protein
MTVNAALITARYTAHATDSFLTERQADGSFKVVESQETKIVRVPAFRGAITFYGLAKCLQWSTLEVLRLRANDAHQFSTPEDFAGSLAKDLTGRIRALGLSGSTDGLLGLHFTAYERVSDYWVPEFFHIRNWLNPPYSGGIDPTGFSVTREMYATLKELNDRPEDHRNPRFRLEVHQSLHSGVWYRFNNGDPELFNPVANAVLDAAIHLGRRGHLRQPDDAKFQLALVRRPVEVVSKLLADVALSDYRRIGGKTHDLAIAPNGTTESTTGD